MTTSDTPELARLAADVLLFTHRAGFWHTLMIRRDWEPFAGRWAFPGGHVDLGETFRQAAHRELKEETGLEAAALSQLGIYDAPDRDPRGRYITVAFTAIAPVPLEPTAGSDAADVTWLSVPFLLRNPAMIAFDHSAILIDAVATLNSVITP